MDNAKKFILDRVAEDANGCWVWQKYLKPDGYGWPLTARIESL